MPLVDDWYAPVYFGCGLGIGRMRSLEAGFGRYNYMMRQSIPSVKGKRILDLGTNNAFNAIQFLRDGARSVIGVELDRDRIAQGELVKEAFEWADNTHYDFR